MIKTKNLSCCLLLVSWLMMNTSDSSASSSMVLIGPDTPPASIVVADEPAAMLDHLGRPRLTQRDAAELLQDMIERATGAKLPIVSVPQVQPGDDPLIVVGQNAISESAGLKAPEDPEGFRIVAFDRGVALLGKIAETGTNNWQMPVDRGTMHAVEHFLENQVGYRFYFSSLDDDQMFELGTIIPELETLSVPNDLDESQSPAFKYRIPHSLPGGRRVIGHRQGQANAFVANHSHAGWDRLYGETNPEYFVLRKDGTRDMRFLDYSVPGVLDREIEHLTGFFERGERKGMGRIPSARYIQVEPEDNYPDSHSESAQAMLDHDGHRWGRQSRLWFDYVRRLAAEAEQRWPDMRVSTLAYQWHTMPPPFDIPDNVDVMLCMMLPTVMGKEPEAHQHNLDLVEQWASKLDHNPDRLYIWDYWCWPGFWTTAPTLAPRYQQRWLQTMQGRISGVFINGGGHPDQYDHFMFHVWQRLLWNPDADVDALLTDYCQQFFGPAAEPMQKFYELLIDRWENVEWSQHIREGYASPKLIYGQTYPPEVIEQLQAYLDKARQAVELPRSIQTTTHGDAWWTMRNRTDRPQLGTMTLTQLTSERKQPSVRRGDRVWQYQGTLQAGDQLVVRPDGQALLRVVTLPDDELIPKARQLSSQNPAVGDSDYRVKRIPINLDVTPGESFVLTLRGSATDGGNSLVAFQTGKQQHVFFHNAFDEQTQTVERVVTIPENMNRIRWIDLYRNRKIGTVIYEDISLKRARTLREADSVGISINDQWSGGAITLAAQEINLFEFTSDSQSMTGQTQIEFSLTGDTPAPPESIYARRVAWMSEAFEVFLPTRSMYQNNTGFFVAARVAHQSMQNKHRYVAKKIKGSPPLQWDAPIWQQASTIELVRGEVDAKVPFQNLGFPADLKTQVRILQDGQTIYVLARCEQDDQASSQDLFAVELWKNQDVVREEVVNDQTVQDTEDQIISRDGYWLTMLSISKDELAQAKHVSIQLIRTQADTNRAWLWAPRLGPPWGPFPSSSRGTLLLKTEVDAVEPIPTIKDKPVTQEQEPELPF